MSSRCSSAPRMRQVYTPRVKDGRRSNDPPPNGSYHQTAPRLSHANAHQNHNPENSPLQGKPQAKHEQDYINQLVQEKTRLRPTANQEGQRGQPPRAGTKASQKGIQGRNLDFGVQQRQAVANNSKPTRPQSVGIQKSSSCHSVHFVDRGVKSSAIKERKQEFNDKFKVAFGYLLDQNEAYLKECRRSCQQKARPKDELFKIKRPTLTSTNQQQLTRKQAEYAQNMHPMAETVANSFGPRKVCGNSTTNELHSGKEGPRADLAEWPDHYKLQGPLFAVSNYANKYPNHGSHEKMVPIATFNEHPSGIPHRANSTSRTFHKGGWADRADIATWNNMHPYGNQFDPLRGTTYQNKHSNKQVQPTQQWPMHDPRLIQSDGIFQSEYGAKMNNPSVHQLNEANYCDCGRKRNRH